MELDEGDVKNLMSALDKLHKTLDKLDSPTGSSAKIDINANGMYISVTCVVVLLIICLFQNRDAIKTSADIAEMRQKYERMQDYLNVIYMQAPNLRPKNVDDHSNNSASDKAGTKEGSPDGT